NNFRRWGSTSTTQGSAPGGSGPVTSRTPPNTLRGGGIFLGKSPRSRRFLSLAESWEANLGSKSTSKEFPGFDKIFSLGESGSRKAFRGNINLTGDETFGLTRAEMQPSHPITVEWAMGS